MSTLAEYDLLVSDYSEKSVKVEGKATKDFLPEWKKLHGRFNNHLKGGPGWIFSVKQKEGLLTVIDQIRAGEIEPSDPLKSSTLSLIDKVSSNIRDLSPTDRLEAIDYIRATFHFM